MRAKSDERNGYWTMRHRADRPADTEVVARGEPRFGKFAAAIDRARETGAPELTLYREEEEERPWVAARRPEPGRGFFLRLGRVRGGATLQWVGIGSCVLLFGVLLVNWLMRPHEAETAGLFGGPPGGAWGQQPARVEAQPDGLPPALLAPDGHTDGMPSATGAGPSPASVVRADEANTTASEEEIFARPFPPLPEFKPTTAPQ